MPTIRYGGREGILTSEWFLASSRILCLYGISSFCCFEAGAPGWLDRLILSDAGIGLLFIAETKKFARERNPWDTVLMREERCPWLSLYLTYVVSSGDRFSRLTNVLWKITLFFLSFLNCLSLAVGIGPPSLNLKKSK